MKRMKILRVGALAIFVMAGAHIACAPANAAMIKASAVCMKATTHCMDFSNTQFIPIVASINFIAPTPGTALVSFDGSMQCVNKSSISDLQHGVVDLTTQIVNDTTPPNFQEPGGGRIALRLTPAVVAGATFSATLNLASSRVVNLAKGAHKFNFKIARNRMDSDTQCFIYNGTFNVVFVP